MSFEKLLRVKEISADYTVLVEDTGTIFYTSGSADLEFTLPAVADGKNHQFEFQNVIDQEMKITSAEGDNIVMFNNATADSVSFTTAGQHIGAGCRIVGTGSAWLCQNLSAGANTVTVVDA